MARSQPKYARFGRGTPIQRNKWPIPELIIARIILVRCSAFKGASPSMSARIDNRRRVSLDPIFGHSGDTRVAASVTLAGMVFALIAGTVLALELPLKLSPQFPAHGSTVAAPTSGPVRVVGTASSAGVPCEQQTWPYTDQGCLTRIEAKPRAEATPVATQASDKLSPITATAPVVAGPPMQQARIDRQRTAKRTGAAIGASAARCGQCPRQRRTPSRRMLTTTPRSSVSSSPRAARAPIDIMDSTSGLADSGHSDLTSADVSNARENLRRVAAATRT